MINGKKSLVTLVAAITFIGASTMLSPIEAQVKSLDKMCEEQGIYTSDLGTTKDVEADSDTFIDVFGNVRKIGSEFGHITGYLYLRGGGGSISLYGQDAIDYKNGNYEAMTARWEKQREWQDKVLGPRQYVMTEDMSLKRSDVTYEELPNLKTYWKQDSETHKWYYTEDGGVSWVTSAWRQFEGYWHYFNADGTMATNQKIDGYCVGADGVWYK